MAGGIKRHRVVSRYVYQYNTARHTPIDQGIQPVPFRNSRVQESFVRDVIYEHL